MLATHAMLWIAYSLIPHPSRALEDYFNSDSTAPIAAFSPDNRYLAYTCGARGQIVILWDLAAGGCVRTFSNGKERVLSLQFSPDGKLLAAADDADSWLWDVASGKRVRQLPGARCRFSPDGKTILTADNRRGPVGDWFHLHVWQTESGQRLNSLRMANAAARIEVSPDGRHVAGNVHECVSIWDLTLGKEVRRIDVKDYAYAMTFLPNGDFVLGNGSEASIWDTKTGQKKRHWRDSQLIYALAGSPDGKWLASGNNNGDVRLSRLGGQQPPWTLDTNYRYLSSLAFSADGTLLAVGHEGAIRLLETATGQEIIALTRLPLVFPRRPGSSLSAAELEQAWQDLAGPGAAKAHDAMRNLAAAPESVAFLERRFRPVAAPIDVPRLVRDLASDSFRIRQKAGLELEILGPDAEAALADACARATSVEFKRRAESILASLAGPLKDRELVRGLRALKVLEHIGSADACKLIEALALGESHAALTQAARAVLERVRRRSHR